MGTMTMFDAEKYKHFKKLYEKAVADKLKVFKFQGREVLTSYAKYLLEYLKPNFEKKAK